MVYLVTGLVLFCFVRSALKTFCRKFWLVKQYFCIFRWYKGFFFYYLCYLNKGIYGNYDYR